jgi:ABC-type transport system involved in multi-copper enzyme maturation permease subunit
MSIWFGLIDPQTGIFRSTVGSFVFFFENTLVTSIGGWVALLIGVVITAFFIPNTLRKGTIDLLLAKPIHRPVLLIYKYIGGLTFMFINSTITIGGVWLVLGLRSGVWAPGFFLTILTLTFFFAILYAVSTLFGVLTRSAIVAILATCVFWFAMFLVGQIYTTFEMFRKEPAMKEIKDSIPNWAFTLVDVVHFVLPRTSDLNTINVHLVGTVLTDFERRDKGFAVLPDIPWTESIVVSLAFIAVMLGLACWRFSTKDY